MLVEVRPLPNKKWHGKTGKESFTQAKTIEVLYDTKTGKYATGLTKEETEKYSKLLGVELGDVFNPSEPHPFYGSAAGRIKLLNQTMFFNDEKPLDFVKIKALKASKFVANSLQEYEDGKWPDAEFVIFDEAEEVSMKASKIQQKNKCVAIAQKMSADEKINMIQILSDKSLKGRSNDFIDVEIDKIIENQPVEFIRFAKMDKQEVYVRATILEAISRNILIREATAIYYMGERIANSYEEAVLWFLDPQNAKMKVTILEKLGGDGK